MDIEKRKQRERVKVINQQQIAMKEAIASRVEAIASTLEAITTRVEAIASRLEAIALMGGAVLLGHGALESAGRHSGKKRSKNM